MRLMLKIFLLFICLGARAQDILPSYSSLESCNDKADCLTVNGSSYLFYDESKDQFFLKLDLSNFRDRNDTANNWLNLVRDTLVYFKAILPNESFPNLSNQQLKTYRLNGRIFYHEAWKDQSIEMTIYSSESTGLLTNPGLSNNQKYDNFKVNFTLPFVPSDFIAYKDLYYNNQTISINVSLGRINLLRPGMEYVLKDVYFDAPPLGLSPVISPPIPENQSAGGE